MIVAKYGGTAITPNNLHLIKNTLGSHHGAVVVSAIGKQYDGDTKVTDLLKALHARLPDVSLFEKIGYKYRSLVSQNHITIDINGILQNTISDIVYKNYYENTLSKGEELSAKVVSAFLGWKYVGAEEIITFGKRLLTEETYRKISLIGERFVTGGFYGARADGRRVLFPRGGSDITGALVASALNATLYENWTDVNGLCVADPIKVSNAQTVRCLSYENMRLLSQCGASVLHPDSVLPVARAGIPINIRNFFNLQNAGTIVCNDSVAGKVIGVTSKRNGNLFETTVVFTLSSSLIAVKVFDALEHCGISCLKFCGGHNFLKVTTEQYVLPVVYDAVTAQI